MINIPDMANDFLEKMGSCGVGVCRCNEYETCEVCIARHRADMRAALAALVTTPTPAPAQRSSGAAPPGGYRCGTGACTCKGGVCDTPKLSNPYVKDVRTDKFTGVLLHHEIALSLATEDVETTTLKINVKARSRDVAIEILRGRLQKLLGDD